MNVIRSQVSRTSSFSASFSPLSVIATPAESIFFAGCSAFADSLIESAVTFESWRFSIARRPAASTASAWFRSRDKAAPAARVRFRSRKRGRADPASRDKDLDSKTILQMDSSIGFLRSTLAPVFRTFAAADPLCQRTSRRRMLYKEQDRVRSICLVRRNRAAFRGGISPLRNYPLDKTA